jgi:hypothetical protein
MAKTTPISIHGANTNLDGSLGSFEVVRTKSLVDNTKGKWFISLRDKDWRWWHSPAVYTKREAEIICGIFYGLCDAALWVVLDDKLARAAEPLRREK